MSKVLTDPQNYTDIANAIRAKNGESTTYLPSEMAAAILALSTGSGEVKVASGTFTANGDSTIDITFDEELKDDPDYIIWHETTADYVSTNRTKYAVGAKDTGLYVYQSSSTNRYISEVFVRGSTSNSTSFYYSTYSSLNSSGITYKGSGVGSPIKNATSTGFTACAYSTSYPLYGTYRYIAVCL